MGVISAGRPAPPTPAWGHAGAARFQRTTPRLSPLDILDGNADVLAHQDRRLRLF